MGSSEQEIRDTFSSSHYEILVFRGRTAICQVCQWRSRLASGELVERVLRLTIAAAALIALTIITHVLGINLTLVLLRRETPPTEAKGVAWLLIRLAWLLIICHVSEITTWALFYFWVGCFPNIESAFYFSGVTYATLGYGDLLLPAGWRILGPVEALTGILMCGLSASIFFAINQRIYLASLKSKLVQSVWER